MTKALNAWEQACLNGFKTDAQDSFSNALAYAKLKHFHNSQISFAIALDYLGLVHRTSAVGRAAYYPNGK